MMRMSGISMKTVVNRLELLKQVRANLEKHKKVVAEAVIGFNKKRIALLKKELYRAENKPKTESLSLSLTRPVDHSEQYATVIQMLEWSNEEKVELSPDEFRQLVQDEWNWTNQFVTVNSGYSSMAADMAGGAACVNSDEDDAVGGAFGSQQPL